MANDALLNAKQQKNDEFYTLYEYIQKEINAYLEYNPDTFKDKVVLCPCDDPEWSNFTKFFAQNFEMLGLKKLISTSYSMSQKKEKYEQYHQMSLFECQPANYNSNRLHFYCKLNSHPTYKGYLNVPYFTARFFLFSLTLSLLFFIVCL